MSEAAQNAVCVGSIAWAAIRTIQDAISDGRLSQTEGAIVLDMVWHSQMPEGFKISEANGGFKREIKF